MLSKNTGIVALALAASLVLVGCAAGATPAAESGPKPAETATPTPTKPADPLEGKKSGDAIDAELAATINADWAGLADDKAYRMPSGEWVYLKGNEALPATVAGAAALAVTPATRLAYQPGDYVAAHQEALNEAMQEQEERTGRGLVFVLHAISAVPGSGISPRFEAQWLVGDKARYTGYSKEEAVTRATEWVNKNPGTRGLVIVEATQ